MTQFRYEATDPDGEPVSGTIDARSRGHAMVLLREEGLGVAALVDARERKPSPDAVAGWGHGPLYPLWPIRPKSVGVLFDQLGRLLEAGVTPHEAFTDLEARVSGRLRRVVREGIAPLASGATVSSHLARYPRFFPAYAVAMFRAGEISGALRDACTEIVHQCDVDHRMRRRWLITKFYFGLIIIAAVIIAPLPRILIEYSAKEPVPDTSGLEAHLAVLRPGFEQYGSHFWHHIAPWLLGLWLLSKLLIVIINLPAMVGSRDWLALNIPLVGAMTKRAGVARFMRTFELLQRAAVPLADCLSRAARATGNILVARRIAAPAAQLVRGGKLTEALRAAGIFSHSQMGVMQTAEETGTLEDALARLSTQARESRDGLLRAVGYATWGGGVVVAAGCVLAALVAGWTGFYGAIYDVFESDAWMP